MASAILTLMMTTLLDAGLLLSLTVAAPPAKGKPPSTPRLLVKLEGAVGTGQVRAIVENLGPGPVAVSVVPAFVLRPSGPDEAGWPALRAPVDLRTAGPLAKDGRAVLHLPPTQPQAIVVPLEPLYWDHYASALWPFRPLRRVALPGRYDLVLELEDPTSGFFWRSNPVPAVVRKTGMLHLVKPD
jgi:hypothetical protein